MNEKYASSFGGVLVLALVLVALLASCGSADEGLDISASLPQPSESNTVQAESHMPILYEWSVDSAFVENSGTHFGIQTAQNGQGIYYISGKKVNYYDPELEISTVVCPQQGCLHQDSSCVAWQGEVLSFGVYRDMWYALLTEEDGSICVRQTNPSDNSREVIFRYPLPDDQSYFSVGSLYFSYGYAYFSLLTYTASDNKGWDTVRNAELIQLDLDGEQSRIISFENGQEITFVGGNETSFVASCAYLEPESEPLLSEEEFYAQNPDIEEAYEGAAYFEYYAKYTTVDHRVSELRLYDIDSGEYKVLASGNDLVMSERGKMCYGNVIVYDMLNHDTGESTLWLYDLDTAQSVSIAKDKWIVEYVILDGKVIYNVSHNREDGGYTFHCVDIYTGEISQIENQGQTDYMRFGIAEETLNYFIASDGIIRQSLSKEDYYRDDYSSVNGF